jgi:CIC family chloride channel protein
MALGGLVVGALAIPFPEVWGNGRSVVDLVLSNPWPSTVLLAILICKVLATAVTAGSGAVGGVFTPTLFTGAMIGCLFGHGVQAIWPSAGINPQAYALVGMGGFLAATTHAPLMAITMVLGMTLDYGLVPELMVVSVISYYAGRLVQRDSIYSESLRRKQPPSTPADISALRVRDVMKPPSQTLPETATFSEVTRLFASAPYRHLPVVNAQNQLRGVVTLQDVEKQLERGEEVGQPAANLLRTGIRMVTPETTLTEALEEFQGARSERLPVVNSPRERVLVGQVSKTDLLLTLSHGLKGSPH